ncbi:MAG: Asp-tRNA(Asn)/Glu-tRNA(Gln) amidotransferase subunit GatB, partial [Anaerolineales bacterium]|nr:Asp-tRNA(Asn)/Glu-tRNA(Gln) amidotransferase subunit GatB [Anaerolineales bacterium]
SQYELPIGTNGWVDVELEDGTQKRIGIRRVHMEEDTGKLTHLDSGGSLVDYNRSGVPLLEIVSEPDIHSGEEARAYGMKIRQILRYLGVNSGDMEKGVLRVEPNISLRPSGTTAFGKRTELKNLNSFRALADGTAFEIARQTQVLDAGGEVAQETRGWHDTKRITFSQRSKEEAEDYRYFPEPDLPPLHISDEWIAQVRATLPELPDAKIARYQAAYGLSEYDAQVLAEERGTAVWFDEAVSAYPDAKVVANWVINNLFALMNEHKQGIEQIRVMPAGLGELLKLVDDGTINSSTAKEVLAEMFVGGKGATAVVQAKGLAQISDEGAITAVIQQIIADNSDQVAAYQGGKTKLMGWFVGQVMKATRGKANPALVNKLLQERLNE